MRIIRSGSIGVLFLVAALLAIGCQSSGGGGPKMSSPTKAVVVNTGHGGTLVYIASNQGDGVQALTGGGASGAECPKCRADAAKYFKTGQIDEVCSECGAHRFAVISPH
jgi:hypothetical protein